MMSFWIGIMSGQRDTQSGDNQQVDNETPAPVIDSGAAIVPTGFVDRMNTLADVVE